MFYLSSIFVLPRMRFDRADPGNYLIYLGDSLIGHCGCAQAQLSISIGQDGKVWHENTQEEHTRNSLPTNQIVDKKYFPAKAGTAKTAVKKNLTVSSSIFLTSLDIRFRSV